MMYPTDPETMVAEQIAGRDIIDPAVLQAMRKVARSRFVAPKYRHVAYSDQPLPIGFGQTISQPYVVAFMTQALQLSSEDVVLEIGSGCGYQSAILAEIVKSVYAVEVIEQLVRRSERTLAELGYSNIYVKRGNGREGWQQKAPFSHILVAAASRNIPKALLKQLSVGGKMILPLGSSVWSQNLVMITKTRRGHQQHKILPVRFVPLVEERGRSK